MTWRIVYKPPLESVVKKWSTAVREIEKDISDTIDSQAKRYLTIQQQEAPRKTGKFASGMTTENFISVQTNKVNAGFVAKSPLPLARWHKRGTGIYGRRKRRIVPRKAKTLRFEIGGRVIFARSVRGIQKNPYHSRAFERWVPGAKDDFGRVTRRSAKRLGLN